jgi:hypothetical protein
MNTTILLVLIIINFPIYRVFSNIIIGKDFLKNLSNFFAGYGYENITAETMSNSVWNDMQDIDWSGIKVLI